MACSCLEVGWSLYLKVLRTVGSSICRYSAWQMRNRQGWGPFIPRLKIGGFLALFCKREVDGLVDHQWSDPIIGKFRRLKTPEPAPTVSVYGVQNAHCTSSHRWG